MEQFVNIFFLVKFQNVGFLKCILGTIFKYSFKTFQSQNIMLFSRFFYQLIDIYLFTLFLYRLFNWNILSGGRNFSKMCQCGNTGEISKSFNRVVCVCVCSYVYVNPNRTAHAKHSYCSMSAFTKIEKNQIIHKLQTCTVHSFIGQITFLHWKT